MNSFRIISSLLAACSLAMTNPHYGGGWGSGWGFGWGHGGGGWGSGWGHGGGGWGSERPTSAPAPAPVGAPLETRTIDQLYKAALAEGGKLIVYAGGDAPSQQDSNKQGFEEAFPGVTVEMVVDFSKYHDVRIDFQLANNSVVFDVAQLQTLQDFPRWKEEGALLNYKPIGWEHIYSQFKDPEGAYMGVFMDAFTNCVNTNLLPNNASWPVEASDYLKPEFKDKLVVTYPNDDDAVLFWFKQIVDKYGWDYVYQFKAQNPHLVRGTQTAADLVGAGTYVATMSADCGLIQYPGMPKFVPPKKDPFVLWAQNAAIMKKAPHPNAAKLYMSWLVDKKTQENGWSWSVRDDVSPPAPYKGVWDYPNGDPTALFAFMSDREQVEIFRQQIGLILGQVQGPSPNGDFDMHPVKAFPH